MIENINILKGKNKYLYPQSFIKPPLTLGHGWTFTSADIHWYDCKSLPYTQFIHIPQDCTRFDNTNQLNIFVYSQKDSIKHNL